MLPAPETWIAPDGTPVTIRPIRADDLGLETEFVDGLSPASSYQRLMSARRLSPDELRHFTDIDYAHEMALIAVTSVGGRERQVGVARYVKSASVPGEAEFAIVLSDDWQKRGLGTKLLSSLVAAAKRDGVRRVVGTTSSANSAMLALAGKMGFKRALHAGSASTTTLALEL
ncbi:MAG TPA: GNAT family N-acetyltransferase [Burkholderiales bacterium]|nr:GNAT family N-acetyltransferase [Burkholderiales bacterium]